MKALTVGHPLRARFASAAKEIRALLLLLAKNEQGHTAEVLFLFTGAVIGGVIGVVGVASVGWTAGGGLLGAMIGGAIGAVLSPLLDDFSPGAVLYYLHSGNLFIPILLGAVIGWIIGVVSVIMVWVGKAFK